MAWLQIGTAKSGNFWLYRILQSIIRHAGLPSKSFIQCQPIHEIAKTWELSFPGQADVDNLMISSEGVFYRVSSIFHMPIEDMDAYLRQTNHVWLQSMLRPLTLQVLPKFDKIIYIVRDPRDVAISNSKYQFTSYRKRHFPQGQPDVQTYLSRQFPNLILNWAEHITDYLAQQKRFNIHVVFYERLLHVFEEEIGRLLEYLGLDFTDEVISKIKEEVSFGQMKQANPSHLRKGQSGQWYDQLTDRQIRLGERLTGPLLRELRYPLNRREALSQKPPVLPQLNKELTSQTIKKMKFRFGLIRRLRLAKSLLTP